MASVLQKLLGIDFTVNESTQRHELGIEIDCNDGTRRKYVKAGAAVTAGNAVIVDVSAGNNTVIHSSAVAQAVAGIAPVSLTSGYYGWIIVRGPYATANVATPSAGDMLGTTGTAGRLGAITASSTVSQAEAIAAIAAATGVGVLCRTTASSNVSAVILY